MTHSFLYGTAVFEGIRAYWNADDEQLYLLRAREHYQRITDSCRIHDGGSGHSVDEMVDLTVELLRRNDYREDCYVRATTYKSDEAIGVKLHDLQARLNILSIPFGDYIATDRAISCGTVDGGAPATSASRHGRRSWAPMSTPPSPRRRPSSTVTRRPSS